MIEALIGLACFGVGFVLGYLVYSVRRLGRSEEELQRLRREFYSKIDEMVVKPTQLNRPLLEILLEKAKETSKDVDTLSEKLDQLIKALENTLKMVEG